MQLGGHMVGKKRFSRMLAGAVILAAAEFAAVAAIEFATVTPAEAQFFGGFSDRPRPPPRSGGLFDSLFGRPSRTIIDSEQSQQAPVDSSRAPLPRKPDPKAEPVVPTASVVVMGDGMADWLAYGLEDAFADAPEVAIVRKNKPYSGLLRYEQRSDLDWWHVARDILGKEKANYVVMMLGIGDRQNIRERDLVKAAGKKDADKKKDVADKADAEKSAQTNPADELDSIIAPEPRPGRNANGVIEFRTDQWADLYSRRIDATVAALKSKGVPVFWVGLPSIRGAKSTADAVYLNDLYRARAEKAGAVYIDVWDGFVDDGGKYTNYGPDFEGQVRRLRSGDGVYFTSYGARKLAHYVEREIRRYMSNRGPIALPSGPMGPLPADGKSAVRPLAGPVVPLTQTTGATEELLGGSGSAAVRGDAIATGVLIKGDAVAAPSGRADDFVWPRGSLANAAPAAAVVPAAASASAAVPANVSAKPDLTIAKPEPVIAKPEPAKKPAQNAAPQPKPQAQPQQNAAPRPPQPVRPPSRVPSGANGPFGWMR
jgi:hypothetical protein